MEGEKKIEKYQFNLKKLLGQGSYAMVYLGKEIETHEPVAVKVIDKKIFSNAYNVKNIQSQIDIMKKVSHQNIVKLYDIYQTTNNMYIVTQLCQDGDLYRMLQKKRKVSQAEAKAYLKDIMNGAKYLHKNGIIHRDLKPANILLKNGVCKLSDFGFAKSLNHEEAVMKSIVGTPLYMSPQILKKAKYTAKSDLWSIGLIYYEMLHGRTPWPAQNEIELINGIYNKKVQFSAEISEKSKDFIKGCLQIYEQDRMSWEQAFNHRLLNETNIKKDLSLTIPNQKLKQSPFEDKQNNASYSNKTKTPTNAKNVNVEKDDKLFYLAFRSNNKDISSNKIKKPEDMTCLTPKGKVANKMKPNLSGLKIKTDMTAKKDKDGKDTSTIKKKISRIPSHMQEKSNFI